MMNHIKSLLLTATLIMLSASCRKDRGNGFCNEKRLHLMQIVQYGTMIPVADADVYLRRYAENSSALHVVKQLKSDDVGMVHWNCDEEIVEICAAAPGYWDYCGSGYDIQMSWVVDGSYELLPKAWVRLSVVDDEPLNPEILIYHSNGHSGEGSYTWLGLGYEQILEWVGEKDELLSISKRILQNGEQVSTGIEHVTLHVHHLDTLDYTYHY